MQHARMLITPTRPTRQHNTLQRNPPRCNGRGGLLRMRTRWPGAAVPRAERSSVAAHGSQWLLRMPAAAAR